MEWNSNQVVDPTNTYIHQLFEAQVECTPDAVAVAFEDQQLTYFELNQRANQLAHYLRSLGVEPDSLVGLCLERSVEMVVGLLGIFKAGGAYVPLDPGYPQERLVFMLEDSQALVLLTQQYLIDKLPEHKARVVCLDSKWEEIAQNISENLTTKVMPDNLAYVIYTSGSTGKPKGVLISHSNIARLFEATHSWFHFNERDVCTLFHSYAFDFSVWELWSALLHGGRLVVVPYWVSRSSAAFYDLLYTEQVTVLNQTPSVFRQLIQTQVSLRVTTKEHSLRLIIFGGEALELQSLKPWFERNGDECPQLINMYGITETTVHVTYRPLNMTDLSRTSSVIGNAIPDLQVYMLDQYLQPVPIGVPGEMYISGAGVARGYLNRPELTAQRFIPNPFSDKPGARLYKTGDNARYLPNGDIEYLGRVDDQVKIRGFRIELREIEAVLNQHPAVQQSVVITREDVPGNKRLVAYVVVNQTPVPESKQLQYFVKQKLPEYMVPTAIVLLETLPLTPNGKVDPRALPAPPDTTRSELSGTFVKPRTPVEEMLAVIWADVLGLKNVSIHDNFFELGGHSLLATQLVSRLRDTFCVELPLRELFESPTVAELAERIETARRASLGLHTPPLVPILKDTHLPLSFAQARLWFLDQLEPDSAAYNIPTAVRLTGSLHVAALQQSFNEIVRCHETLRTTFTSMNGEPVGVIAPVSTLRLTMVELCELPQPQQSAEVSRLTTLEAQRHFDLKSGPLLRATLLRLSPTEHVLLLVMHHIISDGWSMGVLIRELTVLYEAYSSAQPLALPELPIQYADFAHWQRQWLTGEVLQAQLEYWKQQLAGAPPVLKLPTDRTRPPIQTFQGATQSLALTEQLSQALKALSQRHGVTLFMTLLAAFQTLLYRYTGQSDICVGSPIANRKHSETEGLIGFFVNTLVLRTEVSGNASFSELLARVREVALNAYAYQDLPFEQLVEALQPERNLSHQPLFQVMFVLQNAPMPVLELPELTLNALSMDSTIAKFDLTLSMEDTQQGLVGRLEYNSDLFDAITITRMLKHFHTLLEGIVADPSQCPRDLPLLTEAERLTLLEEWNCTGVDSPKNLCIHQLFEAQVERIPEAVAVVFEDQELTYLELNQRANQLAHYLRSLGVEPDSLVGLCLERSVKMVIGLLGILKAGGVYVPLDPAYPQERLNWILSDAQITVLVTQQHLMATLPQHQMQVVDLDYQWDVIAQQSNSNLEQQIEAENLAYIIYTSGSTGKPKGVPVSHNSIAHHCRHVQQAYTLDASDHVLQFASLNFDASLEQILTTLITGAQLFLRGTDVWTIIEFSHKLLEYGLTVINVPPAYWEQLVQQWANTPQLIFNHQLKLILVGGDKISLGGLKVWQQTPARSTRLLNVYGPTETTITATSYEILAQFLADGSAKRVPIGRPFPNRTVYILDTHNNPVPVGVPGELHIGGVGLAQGYLKHPELTAEKFIPNPFSQEAGARLYKTGDLACYLPDGNIEYLGRFDNQVKLRGFRIELEEIEAVLERHPAVQATAVVVQEDSPGDKRLVAYIAPKQVSQIELWSSLGEYPVYDKLLDYAITNDDRRNHSYKADIRINQNSRPEALKYYLRDYLKERLPEYMVPSAFVLLDALPLTPSGKVNRRALPYPGNTEPELSGVYAAPRTPVEEMLVGIWSEVLGLKIVGIHDNFFDMGGHSLLATQVISRVLTIFKVELPLRKLFEAPTVAALAKHLKIILRQDLPRQALPLVAIARDRELPLSFAQQRLWFFDQLQPNSPLYNMPAAVRLSGVLNYVALLQVFQEIVRRHEALRTTFPSQNGKPIQAIAPTLHLSLPLVDLRELPEIHQQSKVQQLAIQEAMCPFSLAQGPLLRVTLLQLGETEHILLMTIHHIVCDGWSLGVLIQEVATLYKAFVIGQPSPLADLPIQYADFAHWQRQWLQGEALEEQLSYWRQQLVNLSVLQLPNTRPRPAAQTFNGQIQSLELSENLTQSLKTLSQHSGVTLFMTLLAAFQTLLYHYTGQNDICVGSPIANRNRNETEQLIGFFVNTLVLRTQVYGHFSFQHLLETVRETTLEAYAHQDLPFEKLVEVLQPERNLSHQPLFQVMFVLQNTPQTVLELPGLNLSLLEFDNSAAKFDLTLGMEETQHGQLVARFEYNNDLFDAATITRMLGHFQTLLEGIVTDPEQCLSGLPLLTEAEYHQLFVEWNNTARLRKNRG
ncbi:non-ribosomal peptide synthetase [Calothrix sp. PCC 7716]|nr:non-ribosomal peptide synthetase [Calothrix sp. PCC 7716]